MRRAAWMVVAVLGAAGCSEAALDAVGLPPGVLSDGLVAHWRLDERAGTVASDGSGNGHDGEVTGGTWLLARFAGGLRVAAGDAVAVPAFPPATANWTVALWIRLSDEQLAANTDLYTMVLSTENRESSGWEVNIDRRLAQPRFVFSYFAPPLMAYLITECSCVETGAWVHLAAVVDAKAQRIFLYSNGVLADQETWPSDIVAGDSTLYFGRWNMPGRVLNADLDDIAIWQRALTAEEVAAMAAHSL